jgi:nicotinate-nucleotide adenylyltransferase
MAPRRIGLFGGSFDPVHSAHVMMARAALNELQLDRLFIIPATRSPFKPEQQPAPDEVRLAMLKAAFEEESGCEIERLELEREGASYAIDTVRVFVERFPEAELFYLIGADHVPTLTQWREADALAKILTFVVVPRPGGPEVEFPESFAGRCLEGELMDISSSDIRARMREGKSVGHLLPPAVAGILSKKQIYQ